MNLTKLLIKFKKQKDYSETIKFSNFVKIIGNLYLNQNYLESFNKIYNYCVRSGLKFNAICDNTHFTC